MHVHSQAFLVHHLDHAPQALLPKLGRLNSRKRAISQEQRTLFALGKLCSFSYRERSDSNGDLDAGCAVRPSGGHRGGRVYSCRWMSMLLAWNVCCAAMRVFHVNFSRHFCLHQRASVGKRAKEDVTHTCLELRRLVTCKSQLGSAKHHKQGAARLRVATRSLNSFRRPSSSPLPQQFLSLAF